MSVLCQFSVSLVSSFGRTDLRKGISVAKFDAESDFEVRLAVAPPKSMFLLICIDVSMFFATFSFCRVFIEKSKNKLQVQNVLSFFIGGIQ